MLASLGFGFWDDWELQAKVTFDGANKQITVNPDVTTLDIRQDVWTKYMDWHSLRDNSKYGLGMRFIGLDPIPGGSAGDIYFLTDGWRMIVDLAKVAITGVLYSDDFATAYYDSEYNSVFPATVSALVNTATTTENIVAGTALTSQQTADAVWQAFTRTLTESAGLTTAQNNQLNAIPTNPVLTNDARLDYLDASIAASGLTAGQEAKIDAIPTNPLLTDDIRLDNLDAPISTSGTDPDAIWSHASATDLITDINHIRDMTGGRWAIVGNQMVFYKEDNSTEVARFNLTDTSGNPTSSNPMQRIKV